MFSIRITKKLSLTISFMIMFGYVSLLPPLTADETADKEDKDNELEVEQAESESKLMKSVIGKIKQLPGGDLKLGDIILHRDTKTISFPAEMNLRKGPLEVLIATSRGRLHESLLETDIRPLHLQTFLYLLGLDNGARMPSGHDAEEPEGSSPHQDTSASSREADEEEGQGDLVDLDIRWEEDGKTRTRPIEEYIINTHEDRTMKRHGWVFVGSSVKDGKFLADIEGNIALTWSIGSTVLDIPAEEGIDDSVYAADPDAGAPEVGDEVTVIITPRKNEEKDE
ncbi:MAG: YdjY domain-containing protein [Verrucomicrobiota bacterium]